MRSRLMMVVLWASSLSLAVAFASPAVGIPESGPLPSSLLQESLRGSMQGQAGLVLDLNTDGYEDLLVGAPYTQKKGAGGAVLVYYGTSGGFSQRPSVILEGLGNLGWSLAGLGNVPGVGNGVFAAGAFSGSCGAASLSGTVTLYVGGIIPRPVGTLGGECAMDKFGYALATGDLNGDGVPDLVVGAPFHSPNPALYQKGAVYVFLGPSYNPAGALKLAATPAIGGIGLSLATGDLNGDGVDDLLLQSTGKVQVYYGSRGSFAPALASPDAVFASADTGFGRAIYVLGDLNGDGFRDVAVGADQAVIGGVSDSGRIFILRGGPGKRNVNADAVSADVLARIAGLPNGGRFGTALQTLAPAGGAGLPDLAVSAMHADGQPWPATGGIFIFSAAALTGGADITSAKFIPGEEPSMHLGAFLAAFAGGRRLAAGAPTVNADTGEVRLIDPAMVP